MTRDDVSHRARCIEQTWEERAPNAKDKGGGRQLSGLGIESLVLIIALTMTFLGFLDKKH
jgi:hypothetical protein